METVPLETYISTRDDGLYTIPSLCTAGYILSNFGTEIDSIEPFTNELTEIVEKMKEDLAQEARILEGTDVPDYIPLGQNELSTIETKEDQWNASSLNGCSPNDPIHASTLVSNSFCTNLNDPSMNIPEPEPRCMASCSNSCEGKSDACGCATDATDESSVCMVPMISEQMLGTPSDLK